MASGPRVVAELGRPETPDETADRKAAASYAYRSSQTTRNLVAALLATLAVVLVVVLGVPRGDGRAPEPIDLPAVAAQVESSRGVNVVLPEVPADWSVNVAAVEGDGVEAWTIVFAPAHEPGFVRVAQAFDADDTWASRTMRGASPRDTETIGGVTWSRYDIADPASAGNISAALGVQAGRDHILIYGSISDDSLRLVAASIADQVRALQAEAK